MRWLIIVRRMARQEKGSHWCELPGVFDGAVEAGDRDAALRLAKAARQPDRGRVEVVAECSWRLMSRVERERLLGDFTPPDETRERRVMRRQSGRGV